MSVLMLSPAFGTAKDTFHKRAGECSETLILTVGEIQGFFGFLGLPTPAGKKALKILKYL